MTLPLVSVCVITYNHGKFIEAALESALSQDYPNIEVVVADDGSKDETHSIAEEFARSYPGRVRVLPPQVNTGIEGIRANARRAVKACVGEYIAFLEGDDLYLPGKLGAQAAWFEEDAKRVLCGHDVEVFDSSSERRLFLASDVLPLRSGEGPDYVIRNNGRPFGAVSIVVRRSALPPEIYDDRLRIVLDWKLWIDVLAGGGAFGYVEGIYARYRRHANNITRSFAEIRRADLLVTLALVEAQYPHCADACRHSRAMVFYSTGLEELMGGNVAAARVQLLNSLRSRWTARAAAFWISSYLAPKLVASVIRKRVSAQYDASYAVTPREAAGIA